MIERLFRSLNEGCVLQRDFAGYVEAGRPSASGSLVQQRRPHRALGYLSPRHAGLNNHRLRLEMRGALRALGYLGTAQRRASQEYGRELEVGGTPPSLFLLVAEILAFESTTGRGVPAAPCHDYA